MIYFKIFLVLLSILTCIDAVFLKKKQIIILSSLILMVSILVIPMSSKFWYIIPIIQITIFIMCLWCLPKYFNKTFVFIFYGSVGVIPTIIYLIDLFTNHSIADLILSVISIIAIVVVILLIIFNLIMLIGMSIFSR